MLISNAVPITTTALVTVTDEYRRAIYANPSARQVVRYRLIRAALLRGR